MSTYLALILSYAHTDPDMGSQAWILICSNCYGSLVDVSSDLRLWLCYSMAPAVWGLAAH